MKKRKFEDGGEIEGYNDKTVLEDKTAKSGQNSNIDDETRSNAMKWVKKMQGNADDSTPDAVATKTSAKTPTANGGKSSAGNTTTKGKSGSGDIPVDPDLKAPKATPGSPAFGSGAGAGAGSAAASRPGIMARMKAKDADLAKAIMRTRESTPSLGTGTEGYGDRKQKVLSTKGLNPNTLLPDSNYSKGGGVKKYAKGGSIDGIAQRGKTRGKYC